jgi:hypothetical protein
LGQQPRSTRQKPEVGRQHFAVNADTPFIVALSPSALVVHPRYATPEMMRQ